MSSASPSMTHNQDSPTTTAVKRRASQACQQCRTRKVKCVMPDNGASCRNCQVDGTECTILLSKRSRRYRLEKRKLEDTGIHQPGAASSTSRATPAVSKPSEPGTSRNLGSNHPGFESTPASTSSCALLPLPRSHDCLDLPTYIRPPSRPDLDPEEIQYLSSRGALSIPEPTLRDELLLAFALYVYPSLPVVDLQEAINAIEQKRGCDISLILFQALMFSGTTFINMQLLQDAGFESRLAAQSYFFRKVKLLYDLEWESDRLVLVQSILLHSWRFISTNDQKDPWHWLGICISLATGIGLNQPSVHAAKDPKERRLWRRIWWTIISRDHIMSTITRKPLRIMDSDIRISPLKFQDFDTQPVDFTLPAFRSCAAVNDCLSKVMLADIFMSQINLHLIGGRIITHAYNLQGFASSTSEWAMWYAPKRKLDLDLSMLDRLQTELASWSERLNNYCSVEYHSGQGTEDLQTRILRIHTGGLRMLYLLTQEALYRPLTFPAGLQHPMTLSDNADDCSTTKARSEVSRVASQIADTSTRLREEGLLQFIPPLSIGCLLTAIASFLVEIKLARKLPADVPDHQYHDCIRSLLSLRDTWPLTKGTCAMVNQMATNNQIWYARSLKMLARPTPTESTSVDGFAGQSLESARQHPMIQSRSMPIAPSSASDLQDTSPMGVEPSLTGPSVGNGCVPGQSASTYLASMYPFLWTAADFDVFGPSSCRELFADPDMDGFDLGGALASGIS